MSQALPRRFVDVMRDRPTPLDQFDQVHMSAADCYAHALELLPLVAQRRVLFVGDADGTSLAILAACAQEQAPPPSEITILDFDKRVLDYAMTCSKELEARIPVRTFLYNVVVAPGASVPTGYDFFHINPPYGSLNGGSSVTMWLFRAADLCDEACSGCVVIADNGERLWCSAVRAQLLEQSSALGFDFRFTLKTAHQYLAPWDPALRSRAFIFSRTHRRPSPIYGVNIPEAATAQLYGQPVEIPAYIDYHDSDRRSPILVPFDLLTD